MFYNKSLAIESYGLENKYIILNNFTYLIRHVNKVTSLKHLTFDLDWQYEKTFAYIRIGIVYGLFKGYNYKVTGLWIKLNRSFDISTLGDILSQSDYNYLSKYI